MLPETILQIIRLSLELALEIIKGIPVAQRQQFWAEHQARVEFWQRLIGDLRHPPTTAVTPPGGTPRGTNG